MDIYVVTVVGSSKTALDSAFTRLEIALIRADEITQSTDALGDVTRIQLNDVSELARLTLLVDSDDES